MRAMLIVAMIAAGVVQKQEEGVFPLAPSEDPQHPVPKWVRDFVALPLSAQDIEFEKLCLRNRIELAVVVAGLTEPPDLRWETKLADQASSVAREIGEMILSERSDTYALGLIELLLSVRTMNCGAVKIGAGVHKRLVQRVGAMKEPSSRRLGFDLISQSVRPNRCSSVPPHP